MKLITSVKKGFTLIELLVVIAVIAVLAVIVLVVIAPANRIGASKNARVKSDLASIGRAATLFATDTGSNCTIGSFPNGFGATAAGTCNPSVAQFMQAPNDPSGTAYTMAKVSATGAACDGNATPCDRISLYSTNTIYTDGTGTTGYWCWKSATGTITSVAAPVATTCAP